MGVLELRSPFLHQSELAPLPATLPAGPSSVSSHWLLISLPPHPSTLNLCLTPRHSFIYSPNLITTLIHYECDTDISTQPK